MPNINKDRAYVIAVENGHRLKWHKLLIYFFLWITFASYIISGISVLSGIVYNGEAEAIYRLMPSLKPCDMAYGCFLLIMGVLAIQTRFKLAGFIKSGIGFLFLLYVLPPLGAIIYEKISYGIIETAIGSVPVGNSIPNLIGGILIAVINMVYYGKREELFI